MSGDRIRTYFRKKCLKKEGKHDILNVSDKWKKRGSKNNTAQTTVVKIMHPTAVKRIADFTL